MEIEYQKGLGVMMQLGEFQFSITTAAYQELKRTTEWRWPAQGQFGRLAALQFIGPGDDLITLPGVIYPEYRGGLGQLDALRTLGNSGRPQTMIDGRGNILGLWVIERVEEGQQVFASGGAPRRQEFTLQLKRMHQDPAEAVAATRALNTAAALPSVPAEAVTDAAKVDGLASSVLTSVSSVKESIAASYTAVQSALGPIQSVASSALGAVNRCSEAASGMLAAANRVRSILGKRPIDSTALAEAKFLSGKASSFMASAQSASAVLRSTEKKIEGLPGVQYSAISACRSAESAAGNLTSVLGRTVSEAQKIIEV